MSEEKESIKLPEFDGFLYFKTEARAQDFLKGTGKYVVIPANLAWPSAQTVLEKFPVLEEALIPLYVAGELRGLLRFLHAGEEVKNFGYFTKALNLRGIGEINWSWNEEEHAGGVIVFKPAESLQ